MLSSSLGVVLGGIAYLLTGVLAGLVLKGEGANKSVRFVAVILWPVVALTAAIWGFICLVAFIFED
jgi:hypothetical protein